MAIVLSPGIMSGAFFIQRIKKNGKEMTGILYFKPNAQMVKLRKKSRKKNRELSMRCIRISLRFILMSRCRAMRLCLSMCIYEQALMHMDKPSAHRL